jgi:signal transduction histidine kinase
MSNSELIINIVIGTITFTILLIFTIIGAVYFFNRLKRFNQINKANILKSLEIEREKISNDLHDAASSLIAEFTSKLIEIKTYDNLNPLSLEKINHLHNRIQNYSKELSQNIEDIYPKELLLNNWTEAVKSLAFRFQSQTCKIVCDFHPVPNFKSEFQIQSYRSIQEIITNIVKHNNPRLITIQIFSENKMIYVIFSYQFSNSVQFNIHSKKRGMAILSNRLKLLNGTISEAKKINEYDEISQFEIEFNFKIK